MGVICPCGVSMDACAECIAVKFRHKRKTVEGNITYLADICVTTVETSTLSLVFTDTETKDSKYSFLFTANAITSVVCKKNWYGCKVIVKGTGIVNGKQYDFEAVFNDQVENATVDIVEIFSITNFFNQNGAVPVPQGSIISKGCQEA